MQLGLQCSLEFVTFQAKSQGLKCNFWSWNVKTKCSRHRELTPVRKWAQSDKQWISYEFLKFRPRWNNIQYSGFSACYILWAKKEGLLNTVWTQYLLWKCSHLNLWNFGARTSSIRWKSTKLWFSEHDANKLLSQIFCAKILDKSTFLKTFWSKLASSRERWKRR